MYENTNDKCKSLPKVNQEQKKAPLIFRTSKGETIELNKPNSSNANQLGPKVEPAKTKKLSWSFKHEDPIQQLIKIKENPFNLLFQLKLKLRRSSFLHLTSSHQIISGIYSTKF